MKRRLLVTLCSRAYLNFATSNSSSVNKATVDVPVDMFYPTSPCAVLRRAELSTAYRRGLCALLVLR